MKKCLIVFCSFIVFNAAAQKAQWGLKAGLQMANFRGEDFQGRAATSSSTALETVSTKGGSTIGYAVGGYVRTLEDVFLQGEMLISVKGAQIERTGKSEKTAIQYGQLDIPLSLGYKLKQFEFTGGPLLSVQAFDNGELKKFLSLFSSSPLNFSPYRAYSFGYHAGVGVRFNKIGLNLRYLASIQPVSDMYIAYNVAGTSELRDSRFQQRSGVVQLTASYQLLK